MRRILLALAGYAFYRWWSGASSEATTQTARSKRTPPARKPVEPT